MNKLTTLFLFIATLLMASCGFRDGFIVTEYKGILSQSSQRGLDTVSPVSIQTKNAKHIVGFPSIFYMENVEEGEAQIIQWSHWLNENEFCSVEENSSYEFEIDCGDKVGELIVFLTFSDSEGVQTISKTFRILVEANQLEVDVFPNGR